MICQPGDLLLCPLFISLCLSLLMSSGPPIQPFFITVWKIALRLPGYISSQGTEGGEDARS